MFSSRKKEYIVEYSPAALRLARVSSSTSPLTIEAVKEIPLGENKEEVAAAVRAFAGSKSNGYLNGSCVIYPERGVVRQLSLDVSRGKETDLVFETLKEEIENAPPELSAHCLLPETGEEIDPSQYNRKEILVCGIPNEDVVEIQEALIGYAIYPKRIEFGTIGLIGALKGAMEWKEIGQPNLLLELDERAANAIIIGPKGIEMSRRIPTGVKDIAEALKEELGLKDERAAAKLLSSSDFDFSSLSRKILRKLLRELQSSIGYYEVQTGQSAGWIHASSRGIPIDWLEDSLGESLNLQSFTLDFTGWLESMGIEISDEEVASAVNLDWMGMFSSVCLFRKEEVAA